MAYKDILVYLDPTAELVERLHFAAGLAKAHGARLVGVDISTPEALAGCESPDATQQMFDSSARDTGVKSVFAPAEKPGEGDAFTHCVDLMVAPAPGAPRATWCGTARSTARSSIPARRC